MAGANFTRRKPGRPANWPPKIYRHCRGGSYIRVKGKSYWLGVHGSPEAQARYARIVAWLGHAGREGPLPPRLRAALRFADIDVQEVPPWVRGYKPPRSRGSGEFHSRWRKEYNAWSSARRRCHNPKDGNYPQYGGRGVWMCARWRETFKNFFADLGPAPTPDHTLDRIDNASGYCCGRCDDCRGRGCPSNCRWVTWDVQARNKRNARLITYRGVTASIAEWAWRTGVRHSTISTRLRSGWPLERALGEAVRQVRPAPRAVDVPALRHDAGLLSEFWR
jgi:hypothetical protein